MINQSRSLDALFAALAALDMHTLTEYPGSPPLLVTDHYDLVEVVMLLDEPNEVVVELAVELLPEGSRCLARTGDGASLWYIRVGRGLRQMAQRSNSKRRAVH